MLKVKYVLKEELEKSLNETKNIKNILVDNNIYTIIYEEKTKEERKPKVFKKSDFGL